MVEGFIKDCQGIGYAQKKWGCCDWQANRNTPTKNSGAGIHNNSSTVPHLHCGLLLTKPHGALIALFTFAVLILIANDSIKHDTDDTDNNCPPKCGPEIDNNKIHMEEINRDC